MNFESALRPSGRTKQEFPRRVRFLALGIPLYLVIIHLWTWHLTIPFILSGRSDFRQFYAAGAMVRRGQSHHLYEYTVQKDFQDTLVSLQPSALPFVSPAYHALFFVPFTWLPYRTAFVPFLACNIIALGICYLILKPWMGNLRTVYSWFPVSLFLGFLPVGYALIQGQDSLLLTTLLVGAFALLDRRRDLFAGTLMGVGLFKFSIVLPIALLFLLWRRWRFVVGFTIVAAVLLVISTWVTGIAQTKLYLHSLFAIAGLTPPISNLSRYPITLQQMANVHGFVFGVAGHLLGAGWVHAITIVVSAVVLIWTAWKGGIIDSAAHQFLFAIPCGVLVSHHLYIHDLSVVLLPTIVLLDSFLPGEAAKAGNERMFAWAAALMFVCPIIESFSASHFFLVAIPVTILLITVAAAFGAGHQVGVEKQHT